jgi:hypothetical protein
MEILVHNCIYADYSVSGTEFKERTNFFSALSGVEKVNKTFSLQYSPGLMSVCAAGSSAMHNSTLTKAIAERNPTTYRQ